MKKVKLFEEFIDEDKSLIIEGVKIDTGRYERSNGKKPKGFGQWLFSYDSKAADPAEYISTPNAMSYGDAAKWAANKAKEDGKSYIYVLESEVVLHEYDFLGMQAQAANMTREEWIAHYGSPEIGSGIDESKKNIYTVSFDDRNGMDWDWDVEASSDKEAIKMVQDGDVLGPHDQGLPRGAHNFTAKLRK
jgi:hypothetical protein